ncbi:MAG TPA: hypothetical protein VHB50_02815, partial [Bryobacteraceae bacterium]|nr:hypothetical protein [Bryobacteraceae bacterium]
YNYRITGSPAQPPYSLYREAYGTPQSYWWQPPVVVTKFDHPELARNYQNQLQFWERRYSAAALWDSTWRRARDFWRFFIGPFLTPALLFPGVLFRHRRLRPWLLVSGIFVLDHATYHAWYPHQSASETVLIVLLLVECWRALRAWQRRRGFGLALSRQLIAAFAAAIVLVSAGHALEPLLPPQTGRIWASLFPEPHPRDLAIQRLERYPGKHLVFVHYGPEHPWYDEWVFNGADIPRSRVVFARMCTPESDAALAQAMGDRDVWIADPGRNLLERIEPAQLPLIATRLRSQSAP